MKKSFIEQLMNKAITSDAKPYMHTFRYAKSKSLGKIKGVQLEYKDGTMNLEATGVIFADKIKLFEEMFGVKLSVSKGKKRKKNKI